MLIIIFFMIHLAVVSGMIWAYRKNYIFLNSAMLAMLVAFPLVGAVSVLLFNMERQKREQEPEEDFETRFPWLADDVELDKSRAKLSNTAPEHIVPFQEALLINNMRIRRELIIDVIFESPDQYVKLLHQARLNEDVEVVHYATTILSELSAKYDARLQQLAEAVRDFPDDKELKLAHIRFLYRYIKSGIAEGYHARTLKQSYASIVQDLLKKKIVDDIETYSSLAHVYSELGEMDKLKKLLVKMERQFPEDEATWMAKLEFIIRKKSSSELADFLKKITVKNIYFSRQNRQKLAFWRQEFN